MTDRFEGLGRYDPFEDTGDWPFREAPPRSDDDRGEIEAPDEPGVPDEPEEPLEPAASVEEPESLGDERPEEDPFAEQLVATAEPQQETPDEPISEAALVEAAREPEGDPEALPAPEVVHELDDAAEPPEAEALQEDDDDEEEEEEEEEPEEPEPEQPEHQAAPAGEHALGDLSIPPGSEVLSGAPHGFRRSVAVVVSRFNGDVTTKLLDSALEALQEANVAVEAVTVVPVPGAFELPLAALALAKTRRYSCVVALGCVIRGETPHFDLVASEAASGLQLAAIETGIPVSFGVLACETREQAEARVDRGAEAAQAALEMADLFSQLRTHAAAAR